MDSGIQEKETLGALINSISRFMHLVACQTTKSAVIKDFRSIVGILRPLKPVLDESFDCQIPKDEQLIKAFEELDTAVNDARNYIEKCPQKISKIHSVLQSEPILSKIQKLYMEICNVLSKQLQSDYLSSHSVGIQCCMQELQSADLCLTSEMIRDALKDQKENVIPSLEDIIKIMENLGLASNQELLMESIALEKDRIKAELNNKTEDTDHINQMIVLAAHIRHCMAKLEQFGFINGLPVPAYFRCPLSLELMLDPVIVASGQTYERSFIQKWLDNGLRVCPKTGQTLAHINLIPNYTVKALIANWCEDNNIKLAESNQLDSIAHPFLSGLTLGNLSPGNSIHEVHRQSSSRLSIDFIHQTLHHKAEISSECGEESCLTNDNQKASDKVILQRSISPKKQTYCHSKSESISSTISSIEISSVFDDKARLVGDVSYSSYCTSIKDVNLSPWVSSHVCSSQNRFSENEISSSLAALVSGDLTIPCHVQKLVDDLRSQSPEMQIVASSELRLMAKHNMENRVMIAKFGAISPLVSLLYSKVKKVQENAVTALLNLSINESNKVFIAEAGAMEPLIHVLESGSSEARENSAATLFSLSTLEDYKTKIGRSGAVKALVNLLGHGTLRGKKDAATALFNLSICHENKARIVQAGAVRYLVELLDPNIGMVDKSVALLANLSTIPEGRLAIAQEGGIPLLVEIVETGSQRGKENAASALLQLCISSSRFCSLVLQEGAVPSLIELSQLGTPRAKEKAQQILGHFRSLREGTIGRPKS